MLALSLVTLRDRWPLFLGSIVTVAVAVALVQSSLLALLAAATAEVASDVSPTEELLLEDGYVTAVALMGMVLGVASFVAVFIVGSTFAFTVAQRRRDFALLRLLGAWQGQVRRLLVGEAILLATIGSATGVGIGTALDPLQAAALQRLGFVPDGFAVVWRWWILGVSFGTGALIATAGSMLAARRAGRVPPLDALRRTAHADRVMNLSRWIIGTLALGGATAMLILTTVIGGENAIAISISLCLVLVIGLSALSPVIVAIVASVTALLGSIAAPRSRLGVLIRANVRDGVRRSASTAAPIIVLVGLVVGLIGGADTISEGARVELADTLKADVVVTAPASFDAALAQYPGIARFSQEVPVVVGIDDDLEDGSDRLAAYTALAIDPAAYLTTHEIHIEDGDLADIDGPGSVALSEYLMGRLHIRLGDRAPLHIDGLERDLVVRAVLGDTLAGPDVLLPSDYGTAEEETPRWLIQLHVGDRLDEVTPLLRELGATTITPVSEWVEEAGNEADRQNRGIMVTIVGLAAIYTVIGLANATAIATAERREEFAILRLTGLTRAQVVRSALWEALTVVLIGTALGAGAAAGTLVGASRAVTAIVGAPVSAIPWTLGALMVALTAAVVVTTTFVAALVCTRHPPVGLAAART